MIVKQAAGTTVKLYANKPSDKIDWATLSEGAALVALSSRSEYDQVRAWQAVTINTGTPEVPVIELLGNQVVIVGCQVELRDPNGIVVTTLTGRICFDPANPT